MVKEIECPHCRSKVMPEHRFSSATFVMLLVLGIIPFILNIVGYAILYNTLSPLFGLIRMIPIPSPAPGMPDLRIIIDILTGISTSLWVMSIATLVLNLVTGIIPAIVYWAFRHGTYNCPMCEMAI